jgi:preprotein translocase subunit SecD
MRYILLLLTSHALAVPSMAQNKATLSIASERFAQSDVLDARYLPSLDGKPTVMITFTQEAAVRVQALTARNVGKTIPIIVDGRTISTPMIQTEIAGGVIEIGGVESEQEAIALAKQISGKDPLPDSLDE